MRNNNLPISIPRIALNVADADFKPTRTALEKAEYSDRCDYAIFPANSQLLVRLDIVNQLRLKSDTATGVRRDVTVSIFDAATHDAISAVPTRICIQRGVLACTHTVCVPFSFSDISVGALYSVTVSDDKTGVVIAEKWLRLYMAYYNGIPVAQIYQPRSGGIEISAGEPLHRAVKAEPMAYYNAKFRMRLSDRVKPDAFLPEGEVRIYFPDGSMQSTVCEASFDMKPSECVKCAFTAPFYMTEARRGICYAELLCLDWQVAGFTFSTADEPVAEPWEPGQMDALFEYTLQAAAERYRKDAAAKSDDVFDHLLQNFIDSQMAECEAAEECKEESKDQEGSAGGEEDATADLSDLTGLAAVKDKLQAYGRFVTFNNWRRLQGLPVPGIPLHAMFCGSPGTGKTTVAKRMGRMLKRAGVLSKGHVVVKERSTLMGKYYSDEESNTAQAIEQAQGGILFIDEAYQLHQPDDPRDPGRLVIETLMTALADESMRDWMLILAGYTDEMRRMFEMNPGLKSRIPESNIYIFDDFTEPQLMEIARNYLSASGYELTPQACAALESRLGHDYRHRDRTFGNARHVINMIQTEIIPAMASRVVAEGCHDARALSQIQACDIPRPMAMLLPAERAHIGFRV